MRLRGLVKASQRMENEGVNEPSHNQQKQHRSTSQNSSRYIDYDPNLPPAAFPTFDQPRVPDGHARQIHSIPTAGEGGHALSRRSSGSRNDLRKRNKVAGVDLSGIPSDVLGNCIASNGDLNPIYVKNMSIMARAGQSPSSFVHREMEDSDTNDAMVDMLGREMPKEAISIPHPEWNDLSPRIQVEILDNLLQQYNWSVASHILGLTTEQGEKAQEYMVLREEQIDLEDLQLQKMRDKQLKSLLKLDNSAHNRIPHRLVFRRTSRQFGRRLSGAIDIDFFSCHVGELENAKRFLKKREVDTSYAGEWSNGISKTKRAEDYTSTCQGAKDMVSGSGSPLTSTSAPTNDCAMGPMCDGNPRIRTSPTKIFHPGKPKGLFIHKGEPRDCFRGTSRGSGSFHLSTGTQQATLLRDPEHSYIEPLKLVKSLPPIVRLISEPTSSRAGITKKTPDTVFRCHQMPKKTSSMRFREKLEQAKLEAQRDRSETRPGKEKFEESSDDDRSSALSLPVGRPRSSDNSSQPTSPGRILRERNPEQLHTDDDIFRLVSITDAPTVSGLENLTSVTRSDQARATPGNGSEISVPASPSPSSIGFSDNVQSMTSFVGSTPDEHIDSDHDEEYDEDEMVLVPTSSEKRHTRSAGTIELVNERRMMDDGTLE